MLGWVPGKDLDLEGIKDFDQANYAELMKIDRDEWRLEVLRHEELLERLYDKLPREFRPMRELILSGLWRSPAKS